MSRIPYHPTHPERVCWGCDRYCPADDLTCGNGSERTLHPIELFGEDWLEWSRELMASSSESPTQTNDDSNDALGRAVLDALRGVIDPELGLDVVELGLVYGVTALDAKVLVELTMTTPACPLGEYLVDEARSRIRALPGIDEVSVQLVWDPPWTPERMTESARATLGWGS
jgi:metal-sulfur cluster biosynthetic enzyme